MVGSCEAKMEVRDGPNERRDGDAIESELCECFFALHELVPCCVRGGRCIYRLGKHYCLKLPMQTMREKEKPRTEHTKLVCLVSASS